MPTPKVIDAADDLWFESLVRGKLPEFQATARLSEWDRPLFGELELIFLDIHVDDGTAIFRNPDGELIGWRHGYDPEVVAEFDYEGATNIWVHNLWEAAVTSRPGEPDADGVRWLC